MFKYIKNFFSTQMAALLTILSIVQFKMSSVLFVKSVVFFITAVMMYKSISNIYFILFKKNEVKNMIKDKSKEESVRSKSLFFKTYSFIIYFIPFILIPIYSYLYLDSLTISILWVILFIEGLFFWIYIKKTKKIISTGENDV